MSIHQMTDKITWLSQKDMAKKLGICVNTFKTHYRPKYPPNAKRGRKLYWTMANANEIIAEINNNHDVANPTQYPPTTA